MHSTQTERGRGTNLALLGALSVALYAGLALAYPLANGLRTPGASWAVLAGFAPTATLLHAALYGLATLLYALALRGTLRGGRGGPGSIVLIVGVWVACSAVLLGAYPGDSTDVFDYLFRGRMLVEHGASPLRVVPAQFAADPLYAYVHWTHHVDTYGPLWEYASWAVAALVGRGSWADEEALLVAAVTGYRLLAISLAGLCAALIAASVRRRAPTLVPAALVAWLWNPLLLAATAVGAHNDLPMLLLTLLALWSFQVERFGSGLFALGLAAHVKLTALLLLPLLLLELLRRRGWRYAAGMASLVGLALMPVSWLLYAPLGGWATLPPMLAERVRLLANSLAYALYWVLQRAGWSEVAAWQFTTRGATLLFALAAMPLLWRFWRAPRAEPAAENTRLWQAADQLTLLYLVIGSFWFQHWYVVWALAPAALAPEQRLARVTLPLCSLLALWLHLAIDLGFTARPQRPLPADGALILQSLAIGLGALLLGWAAASWGRGRDGQLAP